MGKKRRAATLDDLDGVASSRAPFIRTDARAASGPAAPSHTKRKSAFASPFEPRWATLAGEPAAAMLRRVGADCAALDGSGAAAGVRLGLGCVTRALRSGALSAVVLAREAGHPMLHAHLAVLVAQHGTPACMLACSSAQLGQPFGLLRASVIGLGREHFAEQHPLVRLVRAAASNSSTLPWLPTAKAAAVESG